MDAKNSASSSSTGTAALLSDWITDDSEETEIDTHYEDVMDEDTEDVTLSDYEMENADRQSKKKKKKSSRLVKKPDLLEDELSRMTHSEDEFEEKEDILTTSSNEDETGGTAIRPETKRRIQRSKKQVSFRSRVVAFMNEATTFDLQTISGVSKKKADQIVLLRPFADHSDLRSKLEAAKGLNTDIINDSRGAIKSRDVIQNLMAKCENLSSGITEKVSNLKEAKQPMILAPLQNSLPKQCMNYTTSDVV